MSWKTRFQNQVLLTLQHALIQLHMLFTEFMLRAYSYEHLPKPHFVGSELQLKLMLYQVVSSVPGSCLADGGYSESVCEMAR